MASKGIDGDIDDDDDNYRIVWVTIGKTQHPATILEREKERVLVKWSSTLESEWVAADSILESLSPRRRFSRTTTPDSKPSPNDCNSRQSSGRKRPSTPNREEISSPSKKNEESDDDEIEVLLTIKAPTPKRQKNTEHKSSVTVCVIDDDDDDHDDGEDANFDEPKPRGETPPLPIGERHDDAFTKTTEEAAESNLNEKAAPGSSPLAEPDEEASNALPQTAKDADGTTTATTTSTSRKQPRYAMVSSAYLQNLAEICHNILHDVRWRTGETCAPLFRWEYGDDLSTAVALAKYYIQPPPPRIRVSCKCILCSMEEKKEEKKTAVPSEPLGPNAANRTADENEAVDTDETRALYLYCRLFYRKGPWFRIDDVYRRYYAPSKPKGESKEGGEPQTTKRPTRIDENLLKEQYDSLRVMLEDLNQLLLAGLIRSCRDEEECGRHVAASILKADERVEVLSKLGAGRKQANNMSNSRRSGGGGAAVNEIWKQMTQQRSVFSSAKSRCLLPVRRHVDHVIVAGMVKKVVLASRTAEENMPQAILREAFAGVKQAYDLLMSQVCPNGEKVSSCFRLREAPTLVLQRIARLYLCATHGPGKMRGDGTNGWKSLGDFTGTPPLARQVLPPGQKSWHAVVYPGLTQIFGLASLCYQDSFSACVDTKADTASETGCVFLSRKSFLAWEASIELRAQVDYLTELNDLLKYKARRRARSNPDEAEPDEETGDSVDFLGVLTAEGYRKVLDSFSPQCDSSSISSEKQATIIAACQTECEQIMGSIGLMAMSMLERNSKSQRENERRLIQPWLRHLWWDGCLACILWDVIPVYEKAGLYELSVEALVVLLYGRALDSFSAQNVLSAVQGEATFCSSYLLSRRTRSKILDRLVVDLKHALSQHHQTVPTKDRPKAVAKTKGTIASFCSSVIAANAPVGTFTFSIFRGLARRLGKPLASTMTPLDCMESQLLKLRYNNDDQDETTGKYIDWVPITDTTEATALKNDEKDPGGRCSYIGDEEGHFPAQASVNVEQLAVEFYASGQLPQHTDANEVKGGWTGFHDEGGNVRSLFRILAGGPLLGMDGGCQPAGSIPYLTRLQEAPFDLHVAHVILDGKPSRSFYTRNQETLKRFLDRLSILDPQALSDAVYDSCAGRVEFAKANKRKDLTLARDLSRLRTMSFVAAACGGKLLATIFECFCYDYRHYCGGLPDCLMVRARCATRIIDLAEWIGEGFAQKREDQQSRAISILADKDEEFLGCTKVGDAVGSNINRSRRPQSDQPASDDANDDEWKLPERLILEHNGDTVTAECMLVEVKSSNDRLDSRQEDWLNILDQAGNARVCKFLEKKKKQTAAKKSKRA